jgi:hypothetical protein
MPALGACGCRDMRTSCRRTPEPQTMLSVSTRNICNSFASGRRRHVLLVRAMSVEMDECRSRDPCDFRMQSVPTYAAWSRVADAAHLATAQSDDCDEILCRPARGVPPFV